MTRSENVACTVMASLVFLIVGCTHAPTTGGAESAGSPTGDSTMDTRNGLAIQLQLDRQPTGDSEQKRLAVAVSNPTDRPISFKLYDSNVPDGLGLTIDEAPDTYLACTLGGEPPHKTVTILPHESLTYHPLVATQYFLYSLDNKAPFQPGLKTWHVRAKWGASTTDPVAVKLD